LRCTVEDFFLLGEFEELDELLLLHDGSITLDERTNRIRQQEDCREKSEEHHFQCRGPRAGRQTLHKLTGRRRLPSRRR
jgi:hypothetical protein